MTKKDLEAIAKEAKKKEAKMIKDFMNSHPNISHYIEKCVECKVKEVSPYVKIEMISQNDYAVYTGYNAKTALDNDLGFNFDVRRVNYEKLNPAQEAKDLVNIWQKISVTDDIKVKKCTHYTKIQNGIPTEKKIDYKQSQEQTSSS